MREIIGNTTATPIPCADWGQTDSTKPDYIKNKDRVLHCSGGELTGILYTSASTPLFIGLDGKVGMRAATPQEQLEDLQDAYRDAIDDASATLAHVGQINVSNSWWEDGDQWGAQMSGYNGRTGKYNALRVSHNGVEYYAEDTSTPYQVLHSGNKGVANGVATLDEDGKVPSSQLQAYAELDENGKILTSQLPGSIDSIVECDNRDSFPETGETSKIYVDLDTNKTYRWSGTTYIEIGSSLALGETSNSAYRGDRGKTAYDHSQITTGNPHGTTLSHLGVTATAAELNYVDGVTSNIQTQLNKKTNDFSIELYNGTKGNPKPVKFATVDYSTCNSENGVTAKISMVCGHGNGMSYRFLEDVIIKVMYHKDEQGKETYSVNVDNLKYYGALVDTSDNKYDGAVRQYGDIFWVNDTANKVVDFYCLMGQYARVYQTPWKRLTYSSGGVVTQYASCTVYDGSGTKEWANNANIAFNTEIWTFTLEDGSTVTKAVYVG